MSERSPLVSVVVPSYNHAAFVGQTLESILAQTASDLELVVVDDASGDDSRSVIEEFCRRDSRVRTRLHATNRGIATTFNEAIALARGKFLAICASDDVWSEDKLERQLAVLESDEDLVVWSDADLVTAGGEPLGVTYTQKYHLRSDQKKSGDLIPSVFEGCVVLYSSLVVKTASIRALGFDPQLRYMNDVKLSIELAKRYRFHFMPESLVRFRQHGGNASAMSKPQEWIDDFRRLGAFIKAEFGEEAAKRSQGWALMTFGPTRVPFVLKRANG